MNMIMQNQEMKQYFDSLPKSVQETLLQSCTEVETLEQLKNLVSEYNKGAQNS